MMMIDAYSSCEAFISIDGSCMGRYGERDGENKEGRERREGGERGRREGEERGGIYSHNHVWPAPLAPSASPLPWR